MLNHPLNEPQSDAPRHFNSDAGSPHGRKDKLTDYNKAPQWTVRDTYRGGVVTESDFPNRPMALEMLESLDRLFSLGGAVVECVVTDPNGRIVAMWKAPK